MSQQAQQQAQQVIKSDAILVKEFTEASGFDIPKEPKKMTKEEVHFIVKMVIDEMMELMATVESPVEYKMNMVRMIVQAKEVTRDFANMSDDEIIAEQHDAFVDSWYYSLNSASKNGVNLSKIFTLVHDANMAKRDVESGRFLKREDGKIIKPVGWVEPNIVHEIQRQRETGAFR